MSNTDKDVVLALDSGSQSSRALLFDRDGAVLAVGRGPHAPMKHPEEGAVEQDPADIRDALFGSIRRCLDAWGGDPARIAGGALTTQRNTILPVAPGGAPLLDAVSWLDRRAAPVESEPSRAVRTVLKVLGDEAMIPRLLSKSVPRLWRDRCPEVLEQTWKIAPLEAWLHHQLTGRLALAPGGCAGVFPFDTKKRNWKPKGLEHKLLGMRDEWLPEVVEAGREIGRITAEAATATGLPEGLALFSCGGDKQAEALGAGVRAGDRGVGAVSLGTASSIVIPSRRPIQSRTYVWLTNASCEPASWSLEYMVYRGMWTVRWFAQNFGRDLAARAEAEGRPVEALLCDEAAATEPGAGGVVTWPRWSPSLQHPEEVGAVLGLREVHTRGHVFRSLLEGIAFDLKRGLAILERATGTRLREVRVGGGGSRSDLVVQILADVLGLPVGRPPSEELAARGAALVASVGGGVHADLSSAVAAMVKPAPVVRPRREFTERYDALYGQIFQSGLTELLGMARALDRLRK
jgi:sugar (pentulose or hexulose) kinase